MKRSSPVFRNIIRMALGIWRWADEMPRRYQKRTKDAPDFSTVTERRLHRAAADSRRLQQTDRGAWHDNRG